MTDTEPDPHAAIQERYTAACERARLALSESHALALLLLALRARDTWPNATAIILGWSDQGDWADLDAVEIDGEELDEGEEWDTYSEMVSNEGLAWALDRGSLWEVFADPTYEPRWRNRFPIDDIIRLEGDAEKRMVERTEAATS